MSTTKSIFKNSQRKRRSSTSDDADYPTVYNNWLFDFII